MEAVRLRCAPLSWVRVCVCVCVGLKMEAELGGGDAWRLYDYVVRHLLGCVCVCV
jgi:hypothetical protein